MTITKPFCNPKISYKLNYSAKLLIEYEGKIIPVTMVEEGLALLKKLHILDSDPPRADTSPPPPQSTNWPEEETGSPTNTSADHSLHFLAPEDMLTLIITCYIPLLVYTT